MPTHTYILVFIAEQHGQAGTRMSNILEFNAAREGGGDGGVKWNSETCKAPVESPSLITNISTLSFYKPDALPVGQSTKGNSIAFVQYNSTRKQPCNLFAG